MRGLFFSPVIGLRRSGVTSCVSADRLVSGLASHSVLGAAKHKAACQRVAVSDHCSCVPGRSASMNLCLTTLCLCLGVAFGAPRVDPDLDSHWRQWKSWHTKDYHEVSAWGYVLSSANTERTRLGPAS